MVEEHHDCNCDGGSLLLTRTISKRKELNSMFSWRLIPLLLVGYMACITSSKFYLDSDFSLHSGAVFFWGALAFTIINFMLISAVCGERHSTCMSDSYLMSILRKRPSSSPSHLLLAGISSLSAGYYLLATVIVDQSAHNSIALESQLCKRAAVGCIPHDRVMICYLMPIIVQLSLKNLAMQTVFCQWIIATIFMSISIIHVHGWQQLWTLSYSILFLFISFKIDLHLKMSSVANDNVQDKLPSKHLYNASSCDSGADQDPIEDLKPNIPTLLAIPFNRGQFTASSVKDRLVRTTNSQVVYGKVLHTA